MRRVAINRITMPLADSNTQKTPQCCTGYGWSNALFLSKMPIMLFVSDSRYACNRHAVVEARKSLYFLLKHHSRLQADRRYVGKLSGEASHITTYHIQ